MEQYIQGLEQYADYMQNYSATLNLWSLVSYVLFAIGLMLLAKSSGVVNGGLAWVPGARLWVLGSVADKYMKREKGKDPKFRRRLIWALVLYFVAVIVLTVIVVVGLIVDDPFTNGAQAISDSFIIAAFIAFILLLVFLIDYCVLTIKATYRCYKLSVPKQASLFIWVGLFTGLGSIFMFIAGINARRKKADETGSLPAAPEYRPYTPPADEKINEPIAPSEHYEPASDLTDSPIEPPERDAIQKLVDSRLEKKEQSETSDGPDIIMRTVQEKAKEHGDGNGFDDFYRESAEGFFDSENGDGK